MLLHQGESAPDNLTPGDFAVVVRQIRFAPASGTEDLVRRLRLEVAAKPCASVRIGF